MLNPHQFQVVYRYFLGLGIDGDQADLTFGVASDITQVINCLHAYQIRPVTDQRLGLSGDAAPTFGLKRFG